MNLRWHDGSPLLTIMEDIHVASDRNLIDARFPVQYVIRPHTAENHDYRGYAGQTASGVFRQGDEVIALPTGFATRIVEIDTYDGSVEEAPTPSFVVMRLEDNIDLSRSDMLTRLHNQSMVDQNLDAIVAWLSNSVALHPGRQCAIKHTTRWARAMVTALQYRLDVTTLHRDESVTSLGLNEIGRVRLRTTAPLFHEKCRENREIGSFILVEEGTNNTVGAGMIGGPAV